MHVQTKLRFQDLCLLVSQQGPSLGALQHFYIYEKVPFLSFAQCKKVNHATNFCQRKNLYYDTQRV